MALHLEWNLHFSQVQCASSRHLPVVESSIGPDNASMAENLDNLKVLKFWSM